MPSSNTSSDQPRPLSPDDVLPSVEEPSAGFIVQLFVVPAVIVIIIVGVWLAFNYLAQMGNDPKLLADALERDNVNRWQAAVNLAHALQIPGNAEIKRNDAVATKLVDLLNGEIDARTLDENSITLRIYLCRALGEFHVERVVPVLIKAVNTDRGPEEAPVRCSAIEALAIWSSHSADVLSLWQGKIAAALVSASKDRKEPVVRSEAAYALGVVGGLEATRGLAAMLGDDYPDARYNAATGLARHGDASAVPVLTEMLDLENLEGVLVEKREFAKAEKRVMIVENALRAATQLAAANPAADMAPVAAAAEKLLASDDALLDRQLTERIRNEARAFLEHYQRQETAADAL